MWDVKLTGDDLLGSWLLLCFKQEAHKNWPWDPSHVLSIGGAESLHVSLQTLRPHSWGGVWGTQSQSWWHEWCTGKRHWHGFSPFVMSCLIHRLFGVLPYVSEVSKCWDWVDAMYIRGFTSGKDGWKRGNISSLISVISFCSFVVQSWLSNIIRSC